MVARPGPEMEVPSVIQVVAALYLVLLMYSCDVRRGLITDSKRGSTRHDVSGEYLKYLYATVKRAGGAVFSRWAA